MFSSIFFCSVPKDSRYSDRDRDRSPHFRPIRDDRDRRGVTEHSKTDMRSSRDHRYTESSKGMSYIQIDLQIIYLIQAHLY